MSTFVDCVLFVIAIVPSTVVLEVVCMCGMLKYYSLSRHVMCHCSFSFSAIVFHVVLYMLCSFPIVVAPILTAAQNMTTVIEANDTTLECRVASFPLATIEWLNPAGSIITSGVMSFTITTVSNFSKAACVRHR